MCVLHVIMMEDNVKFRSFISLIAAMLLAVSCGTAPEGYTTATVADKIETEGDQGSPDQGSPDSEPSEHKELVAPLAGGVIAAACVVISGCRATIKNGAVTIRNGTGKVVAMIKKPFQKLFKTGKDKAAEATEQAAKTAEATEQAAKTADETVETTEQAAKTADETAEATEQAAKTADETAEATEQAAKTADETAEATKKSSE